MTRILILVFRLATEMMARKASVTRYFGLITCNIQYLPCIPSTKTLRMAFSVSEAIRARGLHVFAPFSFSSGIASSRASSQAVMVFLSSWVQVSTTRTTKSGQHSIFPHWYNMQIFNIVLGRPHQSQQTRASPSTAIHIHFQNITSLL
jgi:hypothetical protein